MVEIRIQHVRIQGHGRDILDRIEYLLGDALSVSLAEEVKQWLPCQTTNFWCSLEKHGWELARILTCQWLQLHPRRARGGFRFAKKINLISLHGWMKTTQKEGDKLGKVIQKLRKHSGFCCFNPPQKIYSSVEIIISFLGLKSNDNSKPANKQTRILGQFKILIQLNNRIVARSQQRGNCAQFHGPLLQIHLGMFRHWETIEGSPQPPIGSKRGGNSSFFLLDWAYFDWS